MEFIVYPHRNAEIVLTDDIFNKDYSEILDAIRSLDEDEIMARFDKQGGKGKSISKVLNKMLREKLKAKGWKDESPIFQDPKYKEKMWRLDFAKGKISVEVAFNHGEAVAWNLLKPVLASEYNHVTKEIQTEVGVLICATKEMKEAGGFDSAVAEFEKYKSYLKPLQSQLSVPIMLIGLKAPKSFKIATDEIGNKEVGSKKKGRIVKI